MSEVPKNWLPPDAEAVAEQQELLDLLDQSFAKSTHEEKIIWQEKLQQYAPLANACWSGPRGDMRHAPPVFLKLVDNRKRGQDWLLKIQKALKGKAALTTEGTWAKMGEAAGDSFAKILTPDFEKHVHAAGKDSVGKDNPVACANLLRIFMLLIHSNNQLALAIYIALIDAIAETDMLEAELICHATTALVLVVCAGHDFETILPVSLNIKNMTEYLLSSTPQHMHQSFTPLSWWGHAMSCCLHIAKDPTIAGAAAVRVVCIDKRSAAIATMQQATGGPWRSKTTPVPVRVRHISATSAETYSPSGTCTFWLDNVTTQCNSGEYVFKINREKSIICKKEAFEDAPLSKINTAVVDVNVLKRVMLERMGGDRKIRMETLIANKKENENKENENKENENKENENKENENVQS
jgi:hypothetical protein